MPQISGIPPAPFVDLAKVDKIDVTLNELNQALQKYKLMEANISRQKLSLGSKLEEYEQTLQIIKLLRRKFLAKTDTVQVHFEAADTLYAKADIATNDTVSLWLGANVMIDYSYDEAIELIETKAKQATESLKSLASEKDFVREQMTTMEVNISKVYNLGIAKNKQIEA